MSAESTPPQSPFEALFDFPAGSTPTSFDLFDPAPKSGLTDPTTGEIVEQKADASMSEIEQEERIEDIKLREQMNGIHDAAMLAFRQQQQLSQEVDPKFSARNSEVAAQFLNIALSSLDKLADTKYKRQKVAIAKGMKGPSQVQNNLIVADRNTLLKSLFSQDFEKTMPEQLNREIGPDKL